MLGAIAGDIVGSVHEGGRCEREELELFSHGCCFTDDSVCTVAVAEALLDALDVGNPGAAAYAESLRRWASSNPGRGYGGMFINWVHGTGGPYGSFGNGGAMRVAAVGWLAQSMSQVLEWSKASAEVTHNHPAGVQGAQAIALAVWLARQGLDAAEIAARVTRYTQLALPYTVEHHALTFGFTTTAAETVPMALAAALEAKSWSQAVANAIHIGGDCDTIACMAGAVAEARFGLPRAHAQAAWRQLTPSMRAVVDRFYLMAEAVHPMSAANLTAEYVPPPVPASEVAAQLLARARKFVAGLFSS